MPLDDLIKYIKKFIPRWLIKPILPFYHWLWSFGSAVYYRFPGRQLKIVFITGTKGKTTTAELVNKILETAGFRTALASTLRFKVFKYDQPNKYKMSVPGRGVLQKLLRQAYDEGCDWVVMEMTSQAVLQSRHKFIYPNALIFTNLEPEHIESHGGYEEYVAAKLEIAKELKKSPKKQKVIIANLDDQEGRRFVQMAGVNIADYGYSYDEVDHPRLRNSVSFGFSDTRIKSPLQGKFNLYNILAAVKFAGSQNIDLAIMQKAMAEFAGVRGRLERIEEITDKEVYVDYAHTPESLRAVYETFPKSRKICVLGNTGGGRDTWKRSEMAKIAEVHCEQIILTDEDPYDEDPREIVDEMYEAIEAKDKVTIELDRRVAIRKALETAQNDDVVLITGKGTDPFIMRSGDLKEPWDDATVVREEYEKLNPIN